MPFSVRSHPSVRQTSLTDQKKQNSNRSFPSLFPSRQQKTCLLLVLHYIDQICAREPTFTISSLTVHRFIISAVSLSSKSHCDAFCTNAHYARVGGLAPAELARLERAFLAAIDWRLACTREVLQLYYVNLVAHSGGRFYIPSSSSSASSASSASGPTTTTTASTSTTAHSIDNNDPTSTTSMGTPGSNPGTSADETMFDSPEDGDGSGGLTSDSGSASMGAISPAVMAAAGPPPPSFGGLGTGAPAPSVEQNMAFARFQQRAQGEG